MRQTIALRRLRKYPSQYKIEKAANLKVLRIGNTYKYEKEKWSEENPIKAYQQEYHLALWITGKRVQGSWAHADEESSFYELKANVENILRRIGIAQNALTTKHRIIISSIKH